MKKQEIQQAVEAEKKTFEGNTAIARQANLAVYAAGK